MRGTFVLAHARQAAECSQDSARRAIASSYIPKKDRPRDLTKFTSNEARKRDQKLRHAISLYHLSDYFCPIKGETITLTPQEQSEASQISSFNKRGKLKKNDINTKKLNLDETVDLYIRETIMNTLPSNRPESFRLEMFSPSSAFLRKLRDDEVSFGTGINDPAVENTSKEMNRLVNQIFPHPDLSTPLMNSSRNFKDHEKIELPPVKDEDAVKRYLAETVKLKAKSARSKPPTIPDILDVRGAQVRDALYGTVAATKAGLEALRDRIRIRDHQLRKQEEQQRASDSNALPTASIEEEHTNPTHIEQEEISTH